jgi:aminoglycoside 6'-N-acetyltransferase
MGESYLIRRATPADLPLLRRWRAQPHVSRWWGAPTLEPEAEKLLDPRIAMWIAQAQGAPFAFIQDYDVHAWPDHHFGYLPGLSRGMDVYVGEPALIGQGHGSAMVRQHVDALFEAGAPAVGIDPHPDNAAALKAFEKAGFATVSGPVQTAWSRAILMDRWAPLGPSGGR